MPSYLERTFPEELATPEDTGEEPARNADLRMTWMHLNVSEDDETLVCVWTLPSRKRSATQPN